MTNEKANMGLRLCFILLPALLVGSIWAQQPVAADAPLPDLATLMQAVQANQKALEAAQHDYLYRSDQHVVRLEKGDAKESVDDAFETFWLEGIQVNRHIEHNGKPLGAEAQKKENERIDKEVAKIRSRREKNAEKGRAEPLPPVSRFISLAVFTNPRRDFINGRPTILADYTGNAELKAKSPFEEIVQHIRGTIWVDEQDRTIQHFDATFLEPFKVAGGLLINVSKGTQVTFTNRKINDTVWLPDTIAGNGRIRVLIFFASDDDFLLRASEYRKFGSTSKILPGVTAVP